MSIDRQYGRIIIVCDDCGEGFEANSRDFAEAIREFKDNGGLITKRGDEWVHWCREPCEPGDA